MNRDLYKIKKHYGENMMQLCRTLFPTILEEEGKLFELLELKFAHSKMLYQDIIDNGMLLDFQEYVNSFFDRSINLVDTGKSPKELLEQAGYTLYECKTEKSIQSFKKYYEFGEELCTFDEDRLSTNYVFFAVKKNVDEIKREDFTNPKRQDEYGTSVISIQFTKGENNNILSIKNRYNHKVNNPDATFSNNLENIIPGLTKAFEKKYRLNISIDNSNVFDIPKYVKAKDGKHYKYNFVFNDIYYCPDNIIIDNLEVKQLYLEKEKYLIVDYFAIDLVNKKISTYDKRIIDSFTDDLTSIEKIEINNTLSGKDIIIYLKNGKNAYIKVDKCNNIIDYINDNVEEIGDDFLLFDESLKRLSLRNVKKIGDNFCMNNKCIEKVSLPNVEEIGNYFLFDNLSMEEINLPLVEKIGQSFIINNNIIKEVNAPNLISVENHFLYGNLCLLNLDLPMIKYIGNDFLHSNTKLKRISMPNVETIDDNFLYKNTDLEELILDNVELIKDNFLKNNLKLQTLDLPSVFYIGNYFVCLNNSLKHINMPNLTFWGEHFLESTPKYIKEINMNR